jgi:hypothetical protein
LVQGSVSQGNGPNSRQDKRGDKFHLHYI